VRGETLAAVASRLDVEVPAALTEVEARAGRTTEAVSALSPLVGGVQEQARDVEERMTAVGGRVEAIAGLVAEQDRTSRALVERLVADVARLEASFASVEASGGARAEALAASIGALREAATALEAELGAGDGRADALAERARALGEALERLPAALAEVEAGTERTHKAAAALAPAVEGLHASAEAAASRIGEAESSLGRQREALDSLLARIEEGSAGAEERLRALGEAATEAQQAAGRIAAETGPELIEALLRVREAAAQAAERAREAISTVIPASAASLGEAGREALARAVEETVGGQMDELARLAERSVDTAKRASERLTRQMLKLGETTAAIEERIDEERRAREEKDADNFSRRVALLIESLNSTAIDVTKILSNEVTDNAWAAYLKGDRGVFTRRAVRLLDTAEAREIARHYEEELEFRDQVNRYIHDFEAMLRRVLADREGSVLSVTILSSDMGKLYVALAQAIERLR
jgi:chromosome segregation ATPase